MSKFQVYKDSMVSLNYSTFHDLLVHGFYIKLKD
jgi:hypothetical protein